MNTHIKTLFKAPGAGIGEKGFTLVEIVISLAVVSISMVVLISALNKTISAAAENTVLTEAVMLGGEKMLMAMDPVNFPKSENGTGDWQTDDRYPRFRFRQLVASTPLTNITRVTLEVTHDNKKEFELQAYVAAALPAKADQ